MISGFVITGVLLRERHSRGRTGFGAFYARRARRILPAAVLVVVVTLIATAVLLGHIDAGIEAGDARWTLVFLANFHFAAVTPTILSVRFSPLEQFWSLAVEEQFYVVYPAFFPFSASLAAGSSRARLGAQLPASCSLGSSL